MTNKATRWSTCGKDEMFLLFLLAALINLCARCRGVSFCSRQTTLDGGCIKFISHRCVKAISTEINMARTKSLKCLTTRNPQS